MKRLITCLSTMLLLLVLIPDKGFAWTNVEIRGISGNWESGPKMEKVDENHFVYDFDYESSFSFKFWVSDGPVWLGSYGENTGIVNQTNTKYFCSNPNSDKNNLTMNLTEGKKYRIKLNWDRTEGTTQYWSFTIVELIDGADPDAYYFVIPELATTANPKGMFKMSPSRMRKGGDVMQTRWSLHLQDFFMDAKHANKKEVSYYIMKGDGSVTYRPSTDGYILGGKSTTVNNQGNGTTYEKIETFGNSSTNVFKLSRGTGVSYTWLLFTGEGEYSAKLEILINKSVFGEDIDDGGYYLVGNFTNAAADKDIEPNNPNHRRLMRKYWFKGGLASTKAVTDPDSIVFRATVPKPKAGWKNLFLAVFSATDIKGFSTADKTGSWGKAIRPQEQWDYNNNDGLDATALYGGLFTRKSDGNYTNQAINPVVDDKYESYTFSMNITTCTYRCVLSENLYIMGPAVGGDDVSDEEGWEGSTPESQTAHAYKLIYDADEQCYIYRGEGGTLDSKEVPIPLAAGKKFAFAYNKNFSNIFFEEDDVVPVSLVNGNGKSTEADVYNINTEVEDPYKDYDTQYVNFLRTSTSDEAVYNENKVNACTFNLPTGDYYIRLYIRQDPQNPDVSKVYYVIRDREYTFYRPNADASQLDGYTTFKSFCDYHAVIIPEDIDVFTVGNANKEAQTVTLQAYTLGADRVLPAETPVILASKQTATNDLRKPVTMQYYKEPNRKGTEIADNLLEGQINREHIETSNADGKLNFLFGYKKRNATDEYVTIGFYGPGEGNCSINTAYLQLSGDFLNSATYSKGWRMVFDGNETTGINGIDTDRVSLSDDAYYTLQGMKVACPSVNGIYIHKGKKIIVK